MANKILNSFDVWIGAQGWKSRLRLKSIDNISLEGIARLRELILGLAVRGKLVSQNPSDEPVSVLLEKINAERERLISEGKLKRQNPSMPISDEDKPFEIPNGWKYARFGNVGFNRDAERIPLSVDDRSLRKGEYDYYGASGVIDKIDNYLFDKPLLLIGEDGANLINRSTPIAFIAKGKYWVNNHAHVIDGLTVEMLSFLCLHINAISLEAYVTGTAQPKMNQAKMNSIVLAIPPLAEQHRIVAKVDELMALCDELEQQETNHLKSHQLLVETLLGTLTQAKDAAEFQVAWATLAQHFDDLFITEDSIDQLKQTILQLAVMGKLVKQDPNDEPASVLLERIKKEKERLVEEGKIKKEKPLPQIANNEIPFELPDGWAWERLANLTEIITKGSSPKWQGISYTENESDVLFITSENVGSYKLLLNERKFVEPKFNEIEPRSILRKGDFLMNIVGGSIGRTAVYDIEDIANINQAVCLIRAVSGFMNESYLLHFFNSEICISYMFDKQVDNARANLSMGNISNFVIPIPPILEQTRIVAMVNELFALCDGLKERIGESQKVVNLMADSILEQVV